MSAPQLNHRLVLETRVLAPDGAGGFSESWQALGTLWAQIRPRAGRDANGTAGVLSVAGFKIVVRGAPQGHSGRPVAGQRFRHGARFFRILAVTEREPDGTYLICTAEEEIAA
ncbi:head-tail adaptor protein [Aestuariicoccus sp. MJ-SS9]|uniref:head-tail adaptor protein n=1 Tax=Aestuariicoccus sp. MJ-SS9 TaxID=3079855 RepID=UPI00290873EA|nr:head-tail adaptor protein [Aestuariicoccus sp. MJ-SS9]MDU8911070.1 head-tail adaptor protein [Aestuariicoccus sp. MJ-SS9]